MEDDLKVLIDCLRWKEFLQVLRGKSMLTLVDKAGYFIVNSLGYAKPMKV